MARNTICWQTGLKQICIILEGEPLRGGKGGFNLDQKLFSMVRNIMQRSKSSVAVGNISNLLSIMSVLGKVQIWIKPLILDIAKKSHVKIIQREPSKLGAGERRIIVLRDIVLTEQYSLRKVIIKGLPRQVLPLGIHFGGYMAVSGAVKLKCP